MSGKLIESHKRATLAYLEMQPVSLRTIYTDDIPSTDLEIITDISHELKNHCSKQRKYYCDVIDCTDVESHKPDSRVFKNHYYVESNPTFRFTSIKGSYKTVYFYEMNQNLYYRGAPDFVDIHAKKEGLDPTQYWCGGQPDSCQKIHNSNYIFLQGILDMPRFNKNITLWRNMSRMVGSSGLTIDEYINKYYQKGKIIPNYIFTSTGLFPTKKNTEDNLMLKINVPANFPAMFWYSASECGSENLEGSEVVLPYTTDHSGKTLTWGYKVKNVERNKSFKGINGDIWQVRALVTIDIVNLTNPIKIKTFKDYNDQTMHNLIDLNDLDIYNDRISKLQEISANETHINKLKNFGISDQTIQKLMDDGFSDFESISTLDYNEIINFTNNNSKDTELLFAYVKVLDSIL